MRCDGPWKGRAAFGGVCGQLLARVDCEGPFAVEFRCPRCKKFRTLRIGTMIRS